MSSPNLAAKKPADMAVQFDMDLLSKAVDMFKQQYAYVLSAPQYNQGEDNAFEDAERLGKKFKALFSLLESRGVPNAMRAYAAAIEPLLQPISSRQELEDVQAVVAPEPVKPAVPVRERVAQKRPAQPQAQPVQASAKRRPAPVNRKPRAVESKESFSLFGSAQKFEDSIYAMEHDPNYDSKKHNVVEDFGLGQFIDASRDDASS